LYSSSPAVVDLAIAACSADMARFKGGSDGAGVVPALVATALELNGGRVVVIATQTPLSGVDVAVNRGVEDMAGNAKDDVAGCRKEETPMETVLAAVEVGVDNVAIVVVGG
jgi:hypothetical protein